MSYWWADKGADVDAPDGTLVKPVPATGHVNGPAPALFAVPRGWFPKPVNSTAHVNGPIRNLAELPPRDPVSPPSPIRVRLASGDLVTRDRDRGWTDPLSDVGDARFTLQANDPQLDVIALEDLFRMELNGNAAVTAIASTFERHLVAQGEEAEQVVTVSGPTLEEELKYGLIYPDLGAEVPSRLGAPAQTTRTFNAFASTGVNDILWQQAVPTPPLYGQHGLQRYTPPEGFPDMLAQWIWYRSTVNPVPAATALFRRIFKPPAGRYQIHWACDDEGELWLDGEKIDSRDGYYTGQESAVEIELGNHFHLLGAKVHNRNGRGGLLLSVLPVNSVGILGTPILRSTASFKVLGNAGTGSGFTAPPRFTAGKIMRLTLAEIQFRGSLPGWTTSFTDTLDSAGRPWLPLEDYAVRVGLDYFSMLRQLGETDIEFAASPSGRRLNAWNLGTRAGGTGTFTAGVNVLDRTDIVSSG